MSVNHIENAEQWESILKSSPMVIVDFSATWCGTYQIKQTGPCKMISPIFETLSTKYTSIVFVKIDVDDVQSVAESAGVFLSF
jgi:thioredoxin 1